MKLIKTNDNELIIKSNGMTGVIVGVILAGAGLVFAVLSLVGVITLSDNKILLGAAVAVVIGVLLVMFASNNTTTLRRGGTSTIQSKRIIGGSVKSTNFETSKVIAVNLVTRMERVSNGASTTGGTQRTARQSSEMSLLLNDNSSVVIAQSSKSSNSGLDVGGVNTSAFISKAPLSNEAKQIADFLGVKLQGNNMNNSVAAVKSIINTFTGDKDQPQATVTPTNSATATNPTATTNTVTPPPTPPTQPPEVHEPQESQNNSINPPS